MFVMAVNHNVEDYDRFKAVFDEFPPSAGGAVFHRINRGVDDPNNITIVSGFASADTAIAFRDNPGLKEAMGRAGVVGHPRFELYEEVESVQY
jgi:hypothetical protein